MKILKRGRLRGVAAGLCFLILLLAMNFWIFKSYREHLIGMTQDNLMVTAKSTANSLSIFYKEKLEEFSLFIPIAAEKSDELYLKSYIELNRDYISSIALLGEDKKVLSFSGINYKTEAEDAVNRALLESDFREGKAVLLEPVLTGTGHFTQFMVSRVKRRKQNRIFYAVAAINTGEVYKKIVQPIKVGNNGYSMVKDLSGIILMHPTEDQIGLNAVEGRQEKYKDYNLDLTGLKELLKRQQENEEGRELLDSYWWSKLTKARKVLVYTRTQVGKQQWIVNVTLNYKEIEKPLNQAARLNLLAAAIILILFWAFLYYYMKQENQTRSMEIEVKYLRELNSTLEELQQKEEQVRHGSRLWEIGALSGMINHEFNNYLTPILIYGELILGDPSVDTATRENVAEMVQSAKRAAEMTKELASYTRKDSTGEKLVAVNVKEQLERSLRMVKKLVPASIRLEKDISPEECYIKSGETMISQIILNLSTNAVHAMKGKQGRITVSAKHMIKKEREVYEITFEDTGMGMSDEVKAHIFDPFFTTKEDGAGTGLGLSVIKELIEAAGGTISVQSQAEKGTVFHIDLPLCQKEEATLRRSRNKRKNDFQRILVVEDEEGVGKALVKGLEKRKYKVQFCKNPVEALGILRKDAKDIDVILTDYSMPEMDGIEFAGLVRCMGIDAKILLLTAASNYEELCKKAGKNVNGILEKPIAMIQIEEALESLFSS
ncbi:ATP-binding protein [Lacrimispora sp.]|uniref:ATP-binding protein n=1 Tax=Lacrimispora sp. TaxID=2719234 RepID=UPI0029E2E5A0|nr:two-component system, cell cycle sensor histidine kinase and response regulator CckA [Lacrimispora sp.]